MRYVILQAELVNGQSEVRLVDSDAYDAEPDGRSAFFHPGTTKVIKKLGEADIDVLWHLGEDMVLPHILTGKQK